MANTFVTVPDASDVSRNIDAFSIGSDFRQVVVLGDPSTDAAVAAIAAATPSPTDYGLSTRRPSVALPTHVVSAASTNATSLKGSAGVLKHLSGFNVVAYPVYVKFHNTSGTPTAGSGVVLTVTIQAGQPVPSNAIPEGGVKFTSGIGMTIVKGIADANSTAVAAADCVLDVYVE